MRKGEYGGGGTFMNFSPIIFGRLQQIICHVKAHTYDIKPARRSLSRVNGLKEGRNNRTIFSKISQNLVIVGFCYHGNIQSICCTGCLKYAFESLVCLFLVDMNCCEVILILCG